MNIKKQKSFTLMEIIVSSLIFVVVFGGLLTSFLKVRDYIRHANQRSVATDLSRSKSRDLQRDVRADSWDTGNLSATTHSLGSLKIDNITYDDPSASGSNKYEVSTDSTYNYRKVDITIHYPD
jgi:type II secretory pathway pseudopilin PulG